MFYCISPLKGLAQQQQLQKKQQMYFGQHVTLHGTQSKDTLHNGTKHTDPRR
jgi:hypothetical protein